MISELRPNLDRSISRRFGRLSDEARVSRAAAALEANGIGVLRAADAAEAKRMIMEGMGRVKGSVRRNNAPHATVALFTTRVGAVCRYG